MENPTYKTIFDRIQTGQFRSALDVIAHALVKSPDDPYLLYYSGLAHRRLNNYQEAAKVYCKSLDIDPRNPSVHLGLGIVYQLQGLYEEAIESLKEAIKLEPNFPEAHNSLGLTYSKVGNYQAALECYERAAEAIIEMAHTQLAKDDKKYFTSTVTTHGLNSLMINPEAFDSIESILKSNLMWSISMNNIALCLTALGERARAKKIFEESIRFIPEGVGYDAPFDGLRALENERE